MPRSVWLAFLILLALLLLLHAQAADVELLFPQVLLVLLFVALSTLPQLLVGPRLWPFTRLMLAALAATVLSMPLAFGVASWQSTHTKRRAALIIRQLAAYQRQHGQYPDSLPQLVPRYLPAVPTTAYGIWQPPAFHYSPGSGPPTRAFALQYYPHSTIEWRYASVDRQWHVRDEND